LQEAIVSKYLSDRMYGFLLLGEETVFFYLDSFKFGGFEEFPPPIAGEEVQVEVYPETDKKHKRARKVIRSNRPVSCRGVIHKFNPNKGFGFIRGDCGECFFHQSDVVGFSPAISVEVSFFLGKKGANNRACFVSRV